MNKTLKSLINEASLRQDSWREIADDPQALIDRNKTREQALALASYYEGRFDGLCDGRDFHSRSVTNRPRGHVGVTNV